MGDIFDLLFGLIPITYRRNAQLIEIINTISKDIEILYLEGNHDFAIKRYFPQITVVPLSKQPLHVRFNDQDILLAHGDFASELKYRVYTALIRSTPVLAVLSAIDALTSHSIINKLDSYLSKKDDCYKIDNFEDIVKSRVKKSGVLKYDMLIEGHFHQNRSFEFENFRYINLGAFACNERYFIVKSSQEVLELEEFQLR
jgi:UDP-2,3-diacylglucosamine hydrolase